jgi:hypothetical protein
MSDPLDGPMSVRRRTEAESIRAGIIAGVQTVKDAVAWADSAISEETSPHPSIIEIALSGNRRPQDVISLLSEVPGTFDRIDVYHRLLRTMLQELDKRPTTAEAIAKSLYRVAASPEWPDEVLGTQPYALDDSFDLVHEGYGRFEDAVAALRAYLEQHAAK